MQDALVTADVPLGTWLESVHPDTRRKLSVINRDRRNWRRQSLNLPAYIVLPEELQSNGRAHFTADTIDAAAGGINIRSYTRLPVGLWLTVHLEHGDMIWSGKMRVVHCFEDFGAYRIGLRTAQCAELPPVQEPDMQRMADPWKRLREVRRDVREMMKRYVLAQRTWNLAGVPIEQRIRQLASLGARLNRQPSDEVSDQRGYERLNLSRDVELIVSTAAGPKLLNAKTADVSMGGVGLWLPDNVIDNPAERTLTGLQGLIASDPMVLGVTIGDRPLWLPVQLTRMDRADGSDIVLGVSFQILKSMNNFLIL